MKRVLLLCLAALLLGVPLATRTAPAKAAAPPVRESGYVAVRDGTLLHYTVVRPAGPGPFPTLFTYDGYDAGSNPDPDYVARLGSMAVEPIVMKPDQASAFVESEVRKWKAVAAAAKIQID